MHESFVSPRNLALSAVLAVSLPAFAGVTLSNVTVNGNGGNGIRVRDTATVTAHGVTVAGRLDVDGASSVNGNTGGSPVAYGAKVAPGAVLTLTGSSGTPIHVNGNQGVGLLLLGNVSGTFVEIASNAIQGVWVDTVDAPICAASNTILGACDVHGNGTAPGAYPPGGLTVLRTRSSTASQAERFQLTYGGGAFTPTTVHDNLGDGVTIGGDRTPTTGLCALLPAPLACGAVDGIVDAATVSGNQRGIVVQELDEGSSGTVPVLYGNMIKGNAGVGLYVYTSHVVPDPLNGRVINENLIGHNGFSDATCTSAEAASQVVFDGPVAASAAVVTQCAGASTVTACNSTPGLLCVWNPYRASNNCQPSYRIGTRTARIRIPTPSPATAGAASGMRTSGRASSP
jgi:hypothetical protein